MAGTQATKSPPKVRPTSSVKSNETPTFSIPQAIETLKRVLQNYMDQLMTAVTANSALQDVLKRFNDLKTFVQSINTYQMYLDAVGKLDDLKKNLSMLTKHSTTTSAVSRPRETVSKSAWPPVPLKQAPPPITTWNKQSKPVMM